MQLKGCHARENWNIWECQLEAILPHTQLAEIRFEKGKAHQRLGQYEEALECFNKVLELDQEYDEILRYKEVLNLMK